MYVNTYVYTSKDCWGRDCMPLPFPRDLVYMCMCVYAYISIQRLKRKRVSPRALTARSVYMRMYVYKYICVNIYEYTYVYTCKDWGRTECLRLRCLCCAVLYICVCMYTYIHMYTCIYLCIYMQILKEKGVSSPALPARSALINAKMPCVVSKETYNIHYPNESSHTHLHWLMRVCDLTHSDHACYMCVTWLIQIMHVTCVWLDSFR